MSPAMPFSVRGRTTCLHTHTSYEVRRYIEPGVPCGALTSELNGIVETCANRFLPDSLRTCGSESLQAPSDQIYRLLHPRNLEMAALACEALTLARKHAHCIFKRRMMSTIHACTVQFVYSFLKRYWASWVVNPILLRKGLAKESCDRSQSSRTDNESSIEIWPRV